MSRLTRLRLLLLSAVVVLLGVGGPAALAQSSGGGDGEPYLAVRAVDSRNPDNAVLDVTWTGEAADLDRIELTENGEPTDRVGDVAGFGDPRGVVIVVDASAGMESVLAPVKDAVTAFAEELPEGTEMALVSYADSAEVVRDFTTDPAAIATGVDGLAPKGGAVMWDGIYTAAQALEDQPELQPNVVVISATPDTGSLTPVSRVTGLTSSLGSAVFAVGIEPNAPAGSLEALVATTGGRYLGTSDVERTLKREVAPSIADQFQVAFASQVEDGGAVDLEVTVGDESTAVSYVDGSVTSGALALAPVSVSGDGGVGLLQSGPAKMLAILLALVAVTLGAYAIVLLFTREEDGLSAVLQVYSEGYGTEGDDDEESGAATTALIQRAVDMTEEFAERQGFLAKTEAALERAALPLRAAEALFFYAALTLIVFVLLFLVTGNVMATLLVGGILAAIPPVIVSFKAKKRQKAFLAQLPDTLALLAGTLRAGYSLMQGVEAVSQEVDEPMGSELRRVVTESRLGRPLEESLESSAERMNSPDFSWAVMAIRIQREVGGNLAELLLTVGDTMTQRERLRRDVAALTAEGKVSAIVLGLLPIGLAGAMFVINPEYISALFTTKAGNVMLGAAVILAGFGFFWMKKTIEIEI